MYAVRQPTSRVQEVHRETYTVAFTAHFTKAAIETLLKEGDRVQAPLGMVHGHPCRIELILRANKYQLVLFSQFLQYLGDKALDTPGEPAWQGQDDDKERRFEFTVVPGTFGETPVGRLNSYTSVAAATVQLCCEADALVYDDAGKLQVELVIRIQQHKGC